MAGLYIHIPFCEKKCSYCDFVSYGGRQKYLPSYLLALKNEALRYRHERIDTVFIGGGTPYYITSFDGHYYLTEHRLPGHSVWQFDVEDNEIVNVISVY